MKRTSRRPRRNPSPLDNPAFRRWFGTSKVVDERGEPLVVYHGTDARFSVFRAGGPDGGIWFSRDRSKIERGESGAAGTKYLLPVYLRILKPAGWDEYDRFYTDQLVSMGYDGLVLDDDFVVFSPTQIKSATDNVGTFDPSDPSILRNPDAPPMPRALYHATPQYNLDSILRRGLLRSKAGSVTLSGGGVFLTDERSLARGYAERRFGVDDYDAPWVLLKIDPRQLDPSLFEADPGQEAELNAEDIEARGYTIRTMPWWVSLEETGQMVYAGDVPPSAIEPVEVMQPTKGDRWEPFAVQKNRRTSRRPRRTSRRSR